MGALLVLAGTFALALVWSSQKLMWNDEFLSFYTDRQPSVADVLHVQLHWPISLDPAGYHLLSHASMQVFGQNALALRLPALLGFLLLQLAVFWLVRRMAGPRAALLSMLLPLLSPMFRYAVEGRPYGLLFGVTASSVACWFAATETQVRSRRLLALCGMALSLGLAVNSHYFGVLVLLPVSLAELARTWERRKLDVPMLVALFAGYASVVLVLPFKRALAPYQHHYYSSHVGLGVIVYAYRQLFLAEETVSAAVRDVDSGVCALICLLLVVLVWRRFRRRPASEPLSIWAGLAGIVLIPFFGFLLARFVTHAIEVRHLSFVFPALPLFFGLAVAPYVRRTSVYRGLLVVLALAALLWNVRRIHADGVQREITLAAMKPSPQLARALEARPQAPLYVQDMRLFFLVTYYVPDAAMRSRFQLVYDPRSEVRWFREDTYAVTAENIVHFTPFTAVPYSSVLRQHGPLLLTSGDSSEWIVQQLQLQGIRSTPLGPSFRGAAWKIQTAQP